MNLDLRRDFTEISAFVLERIRTFDADSDDRQGKNDRISRIDFGYECDQAGWVTMFFDTRLNANPDGEWTKAISGNSLNRPYWLEVLAADDEDLAIIRHDGSRAEIPLAASREQRFQRLVSELGILLRAVLLHLRASAAFKALPTAESCMLGVEHFNGAYGWQCSLAVGDSSPAEPVAVEQEAANASGNPIPSTRFGPTKWLVRRPEGNDVLGVSFSQGRQKLDLASARHVPIEKVWALPFRDSEIIVAGGEDGPEPARFDVACFVASQLKKFVGEANRYLSTFVTPKQFEASGSWEIQAIEFGRDSADPIQAFEMLFELYGDTHGLWGVRFGFKERPLNRFYPVQFRRRSK